MIEYKYYTFEELLPVLDPGDPVFFDVETDGLYGPVMLAQFYQEGLDHVALVAKPAARDLMVFVAGFTTVMHMANYEISTIQAQVEFPWVPAKFEDTFLLARLHYYKEEAFSLDAVMSYALGYDPYVKAGLNKKAMQQSNWRGVLTPTQIQYACMDVYHLLDVYEKVKCREDEYSYRLDIHALRHCLDFQNNGMPVLQEVVESQIIANEHAITKIGLPINSNSWQQVRPYLRPDLSAEDACNTVESDGLALATLALQGNERAAAVRQTRSLLKQISFLRQYQQARIYGRFAPTTRSGRLACKELNLQQIPRALKHCFGYETDDDRVLVYSDYPTVELRSITAITGEIAMARLFRAGVDVHGYTAELMFGRSYTKQQRQVAKTCNFNLLYGGGAKMLQGILIKDAGLFFTLSEVEGFKKVWHKAWPIITAWQRQMASNWRHKMEASTPLGRRYFGKLLTDYLNIMNQGFATGEVTKLAFHRLMLAVPKIDKRIKLVNFVHDSFIFECPKEEAVYKALCVTLAECMQQAWKDSQTNVKIRNLPMPIDVFVGYNWAKIEDEHIYHYQLEG